jgi:hypothetical protein
LQYLDILFVLGQEALTVSQLHDQLKLAITWNRSDVAEEKIFRPDVEWPSGQCIPSSPIHH